MPTVSSNLRITVERTVTHIVQLHEDLLSELGHVMPRLERSHTVSSVDHLPRRPIHTRWHSADTAPGSRTRRDVARQQRRSFDPQAVEQRASQWTANTQVAARAGSVFTCFVSPFPL